VVTGRVGNQPKTQLFPWFFFPLLTQANTHPIVNNLNAVKGEFVSTIDTIARSNIHKTGLLKSSIYTKVSNTPTRVSLGMLRIEPDQSQFVAGHQIAAVLLEGKFESVFKNRVNAEIENSNEINFKKVDEHISMIFHETDMIKFWTPELYVPFGVDDNFGKYTIQLVIDKGCSGEVYNIGGGTELSNLDLTLLIIELMGKDASIIQSVEDRKAHDRRYSVDITKIQNELGYFPQKTLFESLPEIIRWYTDNENWWRPLKYLSKI
jgi:hypothetical protein